MQNSTIGWIGLGTMGVPMAQNLLSAGYKLSVYNRTKTKIKQLSAQGVQLVDSPAALWPTCDVLLIMVTDDAAIEELFMSENGLLSIPFANKTIINMSTISPRLSCKIAELIQVNQNEYIDAPVSGSLKQATEASLVIMAGGHQKAIDAVKPILNCLGKLTLRVGENGAGNSAKLAVNTLLALHAQGLAEAIVFAQSQGIAAADFMEIINNSALANVFTKIKGDAILNDNFSPVFALKHMAKDLRLAKDAGINSVLAHAVAASFDQAESQLGELDVISIIKNL